jgi:hypothetical protein
LNGAVVVNGQKKEATMAKRKGRERDEGKAARWARLVREQERTGESVRGFCLRRGLSESSFHAWRRELGLRNRETFTPVTVTSVGEGRGEGIEVVLSGDRSLRVHRGFDEETLRRLVACLEGERC